MKNIYAALIEEGNKDKALVLVTIVTTRGSSPQVPGASALISEQGLISGTIGGGILEARAQEKAQHCLKSGRSILTDFALYADIAAEDEAVCGGEATILFDAHPHTHKETFRRLVDSLRQHQSGVLITVIQGASQNEVGLSRFWVGQAGISVEKYPDSLQAYTKDIQKAYQEKRPRLLKEQGGGSSQPAQKALIYLEPVFPLPHLVIAGAGHVGQAVAHLGSFLDFEVTVIDDRPEFAHPERFPRADHLIVDEVGKAVHNQSLNENTYVVIVTRGHTHDAEALRACIGSDAAYIGMIGSTRKTALMQKTFLEKGWAAPQQWDKVYAPIGIDIPSKTVQEIAVSIGAQLILVRNRLQAKKGKTI